MKFELKREDIISMLMTFVFGFFFGVYLYFTNFQFFNFEIASPIPTYEEVQEQKFSIVGEAYGGCRSTCPSFQVVDDGSYRYLFTPGFGQEQIIRDGEIPSALLRDIKRALDERYVSVQAKPITPATCSSYVDGLDVRYEITLNGKEYKLDSCGTAVETEKDPWVTLAKIWNYFETGNF